ncbi:hypothetical protein A2U01_0086063, partial [Trifolium medium]|nr:hypothetical protein [Trifolium medium]
VPVDLRSAPRRRDRAGLTTMSKPSGKDHTTWAETSDFDAAETITQL